MPDLTPDQAIQTLRGLPEDRQRAILAKLSPQVKQGIFAKLQKPAAPKPEDRTVGNYASEITRGVGRGLKNDVQGVAQTVMHPIDTATGLVKQTYKAGVEAGKEFTDTADAPMSQRLGAAALTGLENAPMIGGMVQHAEEGGERMGSPEAVGAAAEGITTFGAPELAGRTIGPMARGLKETSKALREGLTGTGPKATAELVKKTQAGNAVADAHIRAQSAIETARNNALKEGNAKYSAVNEKLSPMSADMENIFNLHQEAAGSFGDVQAEPPIIKRLGKSIEQGNALTYADEQALYSELGKELSKGTLSGTTYHAYDMLHEGLGKDMQRIADSQGMGEQLTDARNYWRRMKQTFGKPLGQNDVASGVLRSQSPEMAEHAETSNRIRLLGSFDAEIPKVFSDLQAARAAAKGASTPVPGESAKIGPEEVRGAKAEGLQGKAEQARGVGRRIVNYGVGLKALWDVFHGNVEGMASDVAIGLAGYKLADLVAKALEKPAVVEFLTRPNERDIAQIPPELRQNMPKIIQQAQKQGIKVSPLLTKAFTAAALTGPKTRQLQEMRGGQQ